MDTTKNLLSVTAVYVNITAIYLTILVTKTNPYYLIFCSWPIYYIPIIIITISTITTALFNSKIHIKNNLLISLYLIYSTFILLYMYTLYYYSLYHYNLLIAISILKNIDIILYKIVSISFVLSTLSYFIIKNNSN